MCVVQGMKRSGRDRTSRFSQLAADPEKKHSQDYFLGICCSWKFQKMPRAADSWLASVFHLPISFSLTHDTFCLDRLNFSLPQLHTDRACVHVCGLQDGRYLSFHRESDGKKRGVSTDRSLSWLCNLLHVLRNGSISAFLSSKLCVYPTVSSSQLSHSVLNTTNVKQLFSLEDKLITRVLCLWWRAA